MTVRVAWGDTVLHGLRTAGRTVLGLFDALLPAECLGCGLVYLPEGARDPVCPGCLTQLREIPWPRCPRCHAPRGTGAGELPCLDCSTWPALLLGARSAVVHEDPAARLVRSLKYHHWPVIAGVMARKMAPLVDACPAGPLVPIATTRARIRRRGYNQAEVLARRIAERTGRGVRCVLKRRDLSVSQVALQRGQRVRNVQRAFYAELPEGGALREGHVILVDDVLTTGSTAVAAASALARAGVTSVSLVTFARALPFERRDGRS